MALVSIVSSTLPVTIQAGDNAYIGNDVHVTTGSKGDAVTSLAAPDVVTRLINDGTVVSIGGNGMDLQSHDLSFINGGAGSIRGFENGALITGQLVRAFNHGSIMGADTGVAAGERKGAEVTGAFDLQFTNTGLVSGAKFGFDGWFAGAAKLTNGGTVSGGVAVRLGLWSDLVNTGDVLGGRIGVKTSYLNEIDNSGTIAGDVGIKVLSGIVLDNSGTIESLASGRWFTELAVDASKSDEVVVVRNSGTIKGDLWTSDFLTNAGYPTPAGDYVSNAGLITGAVALLDGRDYYVAPGDGHAIAGVYGGAGKDTLVGGLLDDLLKGGNQDDTISGRRGDDELYGGRGNDLLKGGSGDDELYGGSGLDRMIGGGGDNTFIGGLDADWMTAGAGADVFVWRAADESAPGADSDRIAGFDVAEDVLDFSSMSATAITFLGSGGFTGGGGIELRLVEQGGDSRIRVDSDGDGVGDMLVQLLDTTGLTEANFIL